MLIEPLSGNPTAGLISSLLDTGVLMASANCFVALTWTNAVKKDDNMKMTPMWKEWVFIRNRKVLFLVPRLTLVLVSLDFDKGYSYHESLSNLNSLYAVHYLHYMLIADLLYYQQRNFVTVVTGYILNFANLL